MGNKFFGLKKLITLPLAIGKTSSPRQPPLLETNPPAVPRDSLPHSESSTKAVSTTSKENDEPDWYRADGEDHVPCEIAAQVDTTTAVRPHEASGNEDRDGRGGRPFFTKHEVHRMSGTGWERSTRKRINATARTITSFNTMMKRHTHTHTNKQTHSECEKG